MKVSSKQKTLDMVYIALFAVVIVICSWISIPVNVPFTMQTFGIFLTVSVLGGKRGSMAVLIYILLGTVGIPVFAGFAGGIGIIMGNTGGYIIGFLFSALTMWGMERLFGSKNQILVFSMVLGLIVCYAFGTIWFMAVYAGNSGPVGFITVLGWCILPFLVPDLVKIVLVMLVRKRLIGIIKIAN